MGGILSDCGDLHVSESCWSHNFLLLGSDWKEPAAADGKQDQPVGHALHFLLGHLCKAACPLAYFGSLLSRCHDSGTVSV